MTNLNNINEFKFFIGQKVEVTSTFIICEGIEEYHQGEIFSIEKIEENVPNHVGDDGCPIMVTNVWLNDGHGPLTSDYMMKHFRPARPETTNLNKKMAELMQNPEFLQKFAALIEECENIHTVAEVCDDEDSKVVGIEFRELNEQELAKKDHDLPTIVVEAVDENGNMIRKGYLTPFRAYRFQVSGTVNGEGDYGSTPVCDLSEIARMADGYSVLMPHAFTAIARWARGYKLGLDPYKIFGYGNVAEKWLEATVEWLKTK